MKEVASVSIIMGAYNAEDTIHNAINSILNQTFEDWVFIICDDCSNDNTLSILQEYKDKYPNKFVILHNDKNCGLAHSLNRCLEYTNSMFVARMDADDVSDNNRIKIEYEFLIDHPNYDFVGTSINRFDDKGVWITSTLKQDIESYDFLWSSSFIHPTVMVRYRMYKDLNGYQEKWYTVRCEDYDLWMRAYIRGFKGYNLENVLLHYYEPRDRYKRQSIKNRLAETYMKLINFYKLGLFPIGIIIAIKPLLLGLVPKKILTIIHRYKLKQFY